MKDTVGEFVGRVAMAAVAGLAFGLIAATTAVAADLGGDCCADLEERVAELEATTARKGNRKMSLTISGQVNRSMMYWNDGFAKDVYSVDNGISSSRFRLLGSARVNPSVQAGFVFELDLSVGGRSHQVSQIDDDGIGTNVGGGLGTASFGDGLGAAGDSLVGIRQANWYLDHKELGRVTLGRVNTSTAGVTTVDLGGIGIIGNSESLNWGGGFVLRNGAGTLSNGPSNTWGNMNCSTGGGGSYNGDCGQHGQQSA